MSALQFVAFASVFIAVAFGLPQASESDRVRANIMAKVGQMKQALMNCATQASPSNGASAMEHLFNEPDSEERCENFIEFSESLGDAEPSFCSCVQRAMHSAMEAFLPTNMPMPSFPPMPSHAPGTALNATAICEHMLEMQEDYVNDMKSRFAHNNTQNL